MRRAAGTWQAAESVDGDRAWPGSDQDVVGDSMHQVAIKAQRDPLPAMRYSDEMLCVSDGYEPVAINGAIDLDGLASTDCCNALAGGAP